MQLRATTALAPATQLFSNRFEPTVYFGCKHFAATPLIDILDIKFSDIFSQLVICTVKGLSLEGNIIL
jgi:hypothetical protein